MTPYYNKDGITLYCEDISYALFRMEEEDISLVVADPPFNLDKDFEEQKKLEDYYDSSICYQ